MIDSQNRPELENEKLPLRILLKFLWKRWIKRNFNFQRWKFSFSKYLTNLISWIISTNEMNEEEVGWYAKGNNKKENTEKLRKEIHEKQKLRIRKLEKKVRKKCYNMMTQIIKQNISL